MIIVAIFPYGPNVFSNKLLKLPCLKLNWAIQENIRPYWASSTGEENCECLYYDLSQDIRGNIG